MLTIQEEKPRWTLYNEWWEVDKTQTTTFNTFAEKKSYMGTLEAFDLIIKGPFFHFLFLCLAFICLFPLMSSVLSMTHKKNILTTNKLAIGQKVEAGPIGHALSSSFLSFHSVPGGQV